MALAALEVGGGAARVLPFTVAGALGHIELLPPSALRTVVGGCGGCCGGCCGCAAIRTVGGVGGIDEAIVGGAIGGVIVGASELGTADVATTEAVGGGTRLCAGVPLRQWEGHPEASGVPIGVPTAITIIWEGMLCAAAHGSDAGACCIPCGREVAIEMGMAAPAVGMAAPQAAGMEAPQAAGMVVGIAALQAAGMAPP